MYYQDGSPTVIHAVSVVRKPCSRTSNPVTDYLKAILVTPRLGQIVSVEFARNCNQLGIRVLMNNAYNACEVQCSYRLLNIVQIALDIGNPIVRAKIYQGLTLLAKLSHTSNALKTLINNYISIKRPNIIILSCLVRQTTVKSMTWNSDYVWQLM